MVDFTRFMTQSTAWHSCPADYNGSGFLTAMQVHTVTVQTTVPALATLETYDQVWDMRFSAANCQSTVAACGSDGISPAQQANYLSYIANGGSLFLMGDNGGYPGRDNPILAIANAVDSSGTFQTTGVITNNDTQQGAYINIPAATAAENYQSNYRDLTGANGWIAAQYNGLISNWGSGYPVLKDNLTGDAVAVAFDCTNMSTPYKSGKLVLALDWQMMGGGGQVAYCGPPTYTGTTTGYNERFWENTVDFLVPGSSCSTPTFTPTRTPTPDLDRHPHGHPHAQQHHHLDQHAGQQPHLQRHLDADFDRHPQRHGDQQQHPFQQRHGHAHAFPDGHAHAHDDHHRHGHQHRGPLAHG